MNLLTKTDIAGLKGIGSSMRGVLQEFYGRGAAVSLVSEDSQRAEYLFHVEVDDLQIPLVSARLNFYSVLNSLISQKVTSNKWTTYKLCQAYGVPTPVTEKLTTANDKSELINVYDSVVVKPLDGAHGDGITTDITTDDDLQRAVQNAKKFSEIVLVQQMVKGDDYRLLFLNYKLASAVKRVPPYVVGDGVRTVGELIAIKNKERTEFREGLRKGQFSDSDMRGSISNIPMDEVEEFNGEDFMKYTPNLNEKVQLLNKANVSLGGQTEVVDVSANTPLIQSIEQTLRVLQLSICGVDILSDHLENGIFSADSTYVIEYNASPGFRLHEFPFSGHAYPVSQVVADLIVEKQKQLQKSDY